MQNDIENIDNICRDNSIINENINSFNSENSTKYYEFSSDNEKDEECLSLKNQKLISTISITLENIVDNYKYKKMDNEKFPLIKSFYSYDIPEISINDYLTRIFFYTKCDINSLILSLYYLDKLYIKDIPINKHYIHKLLFSSILISIKYNEDVIYKNDYYCQIFGVSLKELNLMEYNFFILLDYKFYVNDEIYEEYKKGLNLEYL